MFWEIVLPFFIPCHDIVNGSSQLVAQDIKVGQALVSVGRKLFCNLHWKFEIHYLTLFKWLLLGCFYNIFLFFGFQPYSSTMCVKNITYKVRHYLDRGLSSWWWDLPSFENNCIKTTLPTNCILIIFMFMFPPDPLFSIHLEKTHQGHKNSLCFCNRLILTKH